MTSLEDFLTWQQQVQDLTEREAQAHREADQAKWIKLIALGYTATGVVLGASVTALVTM